MKKPRLSLLLTVTTVMVFLAGTGRASKDVRTPLRNCDAPTADDSSAYATVTAAVVCRACPAPPKIDRNIHPKASRSSTFPACPSTARATHKLASPSTLRSRRPRDAAVVVGDVTLQARCSQTGQVGGRWHSIQNAWGLHASRCLVHT